MDIDSGTVSAAAAIAAVVVSVVAVIVESRRSRSAHQVSLALEFYKRFHDEQMAEKRAIASSFLLGSRALDPDDGRWWQVSDVLDAFQVLGIYARAGHVDPKVLYKLFYYWLSHYWVACKEHIRLVQSASPMTWSDAAWLYQTLSDYDRKHNRGSLSNPGPEKLNEFFQWEKDNLAK